MSVSGGLDRLVGEHPPGLVGRNGQQQLEILAVAQGMFQRRAAVVALRGQPPGIVVDRHAVRLDDRAHAAFADQPGQIDRQPVADVHAGVQFVALVQQQGLVDPRLEVELPAQDAAAKGPR